MNFKAQLAIYDVFVPLAPIYSYFKAVRLWPLSDMSGAALPKAMEARTQRLTGFTTKSN